MSDFQPTTKRSSRFGRRVLSLLLLIAAMALIGGIGWTIFSVVDGSGSDIAAGKSVKVTIPAGAGAGDIAAILADKGIVSNETIFRARLRLNGDGADFRSGTYTMKTGSSYDTVVRILEKGPAAAPTYDVTIPEGQRIEETAAYIDNLRDSASIDGGRPLPVFTGAEYLAAVRAVKLPASLKAPAGTKSVEGIIFPATFQMKYSDTAETFVKKQVDAFNDVMSSINMQRATKANLTQYDVVIIASLIEREARLAEERRLVSAVIWNRLRIGEPLGIDASNQYDVYTPGSKEFWVRELRQSHLDRDSPYNLRKVAGLPPTPIANPSRASLEAAANPADVDYRYYVANPDGSGEHFFTADYNEFLNHPYQGG